MMPVQPSRRGTVPELSEPSAPAAAVSRWLLGAAAAMWALSARLWHRSATRAARRPHRSPPAHRSRADALAIGLGCDRDVGAGSIRR